MAITAAQVDTQINAAWAAFQINEKSYTVDGRTLEFHTLDEMQRHIDWLMTLANKLSMKASGDANEAVCPVVQYQNSE
tara:strand:+ start:3410 stop:3643 length:234 start_codon:yes stop_codon:yes gene_type:complete